MDGGGLQNEFRFQVAQRGGIINDLIMCLMMSSVEHSFSQRTKRECDKRTVSCGIAKIRLRAAYRHNTIYGWSCTLVINSTG